MTMTLRRLDLRHLPPPQPMECILAELPGLLPGERLVALTPQRPLPLLEVLQAWGYAYRVQDLADGQACVVICLSEDAAALAPPKVA